MNDSILHMAAMGAMTSLAAPALIIATRNHFWWRALSVPPLAALVGFPVLHAAIVLDDHDAIDLQGFTLHGALFIGALIFWLPVLAGTRRLDPGARAGYLFLATPALDLPAVVIVARGHSAGGLAMIVAMLPIGIAAVAFTWQWLVAEERNAVAQESTRVRS